MISPMENLGPSVDIALLADSVQAVGGKLFVLGGGWDTLFVPSFPARHPSLGIGLRIRVPTSSMSEGMTIDVDLQDADGNSLLPKPLRHPVRLNRDRQPEDATDVGIVRAFTLNNLQFREPGFYSFVISLDDEPRSRLRFRVTERPRRS
ncbi:MAG: hypothetical protein GEU79_01015 [Acidimicrobiia bacterium]|nr:hypothetical protein [Acidimicrobiia bacterium]